MDDFRVAKLSKTNVLEVVASEVRVCTKCSLWRTRKNAVPGEGSPDAKVMFVGEAPGYWEDVKSARTRSMVFIGNVLKCRPPGNREPLPTEIKTCTPYLDRQIKAMGPMFIVTLGNNSSAYVFSKAGLAFNSITQARGKFYQANILDLEVTIFPTFHPAAGALQRQIQATINRRLQT